MRTKVRVRVQDIGKPFGYNGSCEVKIMPWKESNKMEQKELFIKEMLKQDKPFKHLCGQFGISEKTGYKWKKRFYEKGKAGLEEESRNPTHNNQIDGDTAAQLIRIKNAHKAWGPKKIREIYAKTGSVQYKVNIGHSN